MVAAEGVPAERQLGEVARSHHQAPQLVRLAHQQHRPVARLDVLERHILPIRGLADVLEVAGAPLADVDLFERHGAGLGEPGRVGAGAAARAEAWHREGVNPVARQAEAVEGAQAHQQRQRRVEPAREAEHQVLDAGVREALGEAGRLDGEDLLAASGALVIGRGDERRRIDHPVEGRRRVGGDVHVHGAPCLVAERGRRIHEARRLGPLEREVLEIHVHDQQLPLGVEAVRLGEQRAVLGGERVAAEHRVLRRLADAGRGVDVRADRAGRLLRDEGAPVVGLSHQVVRRRQVQDDARALQRQERAGGQRAPQVFADLDAEDEARHVRRPKDDVGAEGDGPAAENELARQEVAGRREPALLVVLLVAWDRGLRHQRAHVAARHDRRHVVERAVEGHREADDEHGAEARGGAGQREQGVGGAVDQQVLVEQVAGGVAREAHLGEDRQLRPLVVGAPGEGQHLLQVGRHVGHLRRRHRGRHAHEPEVGGGDGIRHRTGL